VFDDGIFEVFVPDAIDERVVCHGHEVQSVSTVLIPSGFCYSRIIARDQRTERERSLLNVFELCAQSAHQIRASPTYFIEMIKCDQFR
jgi:hypothetical protein